jgi:molecular chaperone GrpE
MHMDELENEDELLLEEDDDTVGDSEEDIAASEGRAETKIAKLRKELEQAKREKQENLDGWQRAKADYVNALKRFDEEKKAAVDLGTFKAAGAFLSVVDSLERAKASAGEAGLPGGFDGILKQLEGAVAKLGLMQFGAIGEKFDPILHEALGQDPTDDKDQDDVITAILEPGWKSGDYVLRPAKVRVSHFEG